VSLLTCEFDDGDVAGRRPAARGTESLAVREWHATSDGAEKNWNHDYEPTLFVDELRDALDTLQQALRPDPKVTSTRYEEWYTSLDVRERSTVLRVGLDRVMEVRTLAREILLDAKEQPEAGGWRVVHGIVDSLWVQPVDREEQKSLGDLAATISEEANIPLEIEDRFDWVCFVPRRDSEAGALTKYFGKVAGREEYKLRGIEARQRSTPPFIEALQRDLIRTLDEHRDPEAVCDRLQRGLRRLERGDVPAEELVITKRVSKRREVYQQRTQTVAALERAATQGLDCHPGQSVAYVVVDDSRRSRERVQLTHESLEPYDDTFYYDLALRAAESVLSPLRWSRDRITRYLSGLNMTTLRTV
jgi:DNA polymerase I